MLLKKTIKDFKFVLDEMEKLTRPLPKAKRDELAGILKTLIVLLWALKKSSKMGKFILADEE